MCSSLSPEVRRSRVSTQRLTRRRRLGRRELPLLGRSELGWAGRLCGADAEIPRCFDWVPIAAHDARAARVKSDCFAPPAVRRRQRSMLHGQFRGCGPRYALRTGVVAMKLMSGFSTRSGPGSAQTVRRSRQRRRDANSRAASVARPMTAPAMKLSGRYCNSSRCRPTGTRNAKNAWL